MQYSRLMIFITNLKSWPHDEMQWAWTQIEWVGKGHKQQLEATK